LILGQSKQVKTGKTRADRFWVVEISVNDRVASVKILQMTTERWK